MISIVQKNTSHVNSEPNGKFLQECNETNTVMTVDNLNSSMEDGEERTGNVPSSNVIVQTETDIVHPRLANNSRRGYNHQELHTGSTLENSSTGLPLLEPAIPAGSGPTPSSSIEFRNRSVENLKSGTGEINKTFQNGNSKQRHTQQHASVKMSLLRTFGLSRRGQAKDEVTQRITSDPGVSTQLNHSHHATVIATESLNLPPSTPSSNPRLSQPLDEYNGGGRNKIRNIKKTISNIFHFKANRDSGGITGCTATSSGGSPDNNSSDKRLPSLLKFAKRNKSLPPSKRALPPVPTSSTPPVLSANNQQNRRRNHSRTPSPAAASNDLTAANAGSALNTSNGSADLFSAAAGGSSATAAAAADVSPRLDGSGAATEDDSQMDFAASIERVKDHGWYWGPLSGEAAERILAQEPDGSFVVRDSSDQHYIFSLTFKLNGFVRHVRIEHDQGNFSFGSFTKFKSTTIVDFIENAVEHSRSGRYLFFLHRRPVLGPMRVQLLHPVSRFKRVQSLQHLCRYVIVKLVRKDHLSSLPIPNRIKTYLNTPFYYSEQIAEENEESTGFNIDDPLNFDVNLDDSNEEIPTDPSEHVTVEDNSTPSQPIAGQNNTENSENQVHVDQESHAYESNVERAVDTKESIAEVVNKHEDSHMGIQNKIEKDKNNVLESEPEKYLDINHEVLEGASSIDTDLVTNLDLKSSQISNLNDDHELLKPIDNVEDNIKHDNLEEFSQPSVSDDNILMNHLDHNETFEKVTLDSCDDDNSIELVEKSSEKSTEDLKKEIELSKDNSESSQLLESDSVDLNKS